MRLAVLADIHGNLPALKAVLADAQLSRCSEPPSRGRPMRRITTQGEVLSLSPPSGTRAGRLKTTGLRQAE